MTSPAPYCRAGITPSKSKYSIGWSSTWTAIRRTPGPASDPWGRPSRRARRRSRGGSRSGGGWPGGAGRRTGAGPTPGGGARPAGATRPSAPAGSGVFAKSRLRRYSSRGMGRSMPRRPGRHRVSRAELLDQVENRSSSRWGNPDGRPLNGPEPGVGMLVLAASDGPPRVAPGSRAARHGSRSGSASSWSSCPRYRSCRRLRGDRARAHGRERGLAAADGSASPLVLGRATPRIRRLRRRAGRGSAPRLASRRRRLGARPLRVATTGAGLSLPARPWPP